ncbi:hypothetical protein ACYSNU_00670 [Enterococcus sp. LJL120]
MTILEWLIIIGIAVAIIACIFTLIFLYLTISRQKKVSKLSKRPPKSKKRRRRWEKLRQRYLRQKNSALRSLIIFLVITFIFGGGTAYGMYYQSTNLSSDDAEAVVQSYFLVHTFETQLTEAANGEGEEDAVTRNLQYLATSLASYGSKNASSLNTVEGQSVLNRYYAAIGELGINASRQVSEFYGNPDLAATYTSSLERITSLEEAAFSYYEVDQDMLDQEITAQQSQ